MKILKTDLNNAVDKGIITSSQADGLWNFLGSLRESQPRFQALHILYYFGGILVLASMSWFLTKAWERGFDIMAISLIFGVLYLMVGSNLWTKENLKIPGGLLITAAVGLVPVFIYGFQKTTGIWPEEAQTNFRDYHLYIKGSWLFMEIGTIIAALIALKYFKFVFITFPLALTLWYMSMDITPLLFGKNDYSWEERKIVSCVFGLFTLIAAYFINKKYIEDDFAFWIYLYGVLAFWGGLTAMDSNNELGKFIYCLVNIGFVVLSVYLRRKIFMIFGVLGVFGYISYLAWEFFEDSQLFPIILTLLGVLIILAAVKYQKNKDRFEAKVESCLPTFLKKWRPEERV